MDKQHAMDVLNSKQLHNVVALFEKYAQTPGAVDICVKDLDFSGLQIGYSKGGKEAIFNLAFPNPLENFEGIRDALIALLGEEAPNGAQPNQNLQGNSNPQQGFGPQAQGFNPHNPQGSFNPQGFAQQGGFNPQAQHPFGGYAPFGAQGPQGANPQQSFNPQGFQGFAQQGMPFAHHGMFMFGFVPLWGFGPMGFHAHNPQWGFDPQGFGPQNVFNPQGQGFNPQHQHPQDSAQPAQAQPAQPQD
ncbi:hypothetical protein NHP190003_07730 [Helicobacter sp. NHP19-003]|uniref:DUF2470 domain-containing protein n=1 Tax=Helicobacter gastrocanis TaxID=2849641 RepID=A0ABM7SAW3_9HELI|nr:hypothetical protein [Helicobacter sp. NHP19-003]BCZ17491.1 hypothetical protein NHP190003_07730 [Helicobacter sp. NHP19-003]